MLSLAPTYGHVTGSYNCTLDCKDQQRTQKTDVQWRQGIWHQGVFVLLQLNNLRWGMQMQ